MTGRRMIHNPGFLSDDDLVRSFVVREVELATLLETVRENTGNSNQHVLVVSPRGMGKTTLVRRLAIAVDRDADLSKRWYALLFPEEIYGVGSVGELWLEALHCVALQTGLDRWRRIHESASREMDPRRLEETALARLLDFADEQGRRLLLVVENLDMLFEGQLSDDDGWTLRKTLQGEPRIMLLGTALSRFGQIQESDKALFDLFAIRDLGALPDTDAARLWSARTGQDITPLRIRPLSILTGGNPRLLTLVSGFSVGRTFGQVLQDLESLIDENTTYFKANLESLPALERKVFVGLADLWEPSLARDVAQRVRLDVNKTSACLKRLTEKGVVVEVSQTRRKARYQVVERLYNIYHLMRCRGGAADRVRALVAFMTGFYAEEELKEKARALLCEAVGLERDRRCHHLAAFEGIYRAIHSPGAREDLVKGTREVLCALGDELPEGLRREETVAVALGRVKEPRGKARRDTEAWRAYARSLENRDPPDLKGVVAAWEEVVSLSPADPEGLISLARLARNMGRMDEALSHAGRFTQARPDLGAGHAYHGELLVATGRFKEAAESFEHALSAVRPWPEARLTYAECLRRLGRPAEALQILARYLEEFPGEPNGRVQEGLLLQDLREMQRAEAAYREAIRLAPEESNAYGNLAALLRDVGRLEEAVEMFKDAISRDPEATWLWLRLGEVLLDMGRYEDALVPARRVLQGEPSNVDALLLCGSILQNLPEKTKEAEAMFREAVRLHPEDPWTRFHLGQFLTNHRKELVEGEQYLRLALEVEPDQTPAWELLLRNLASQPDRMPDLETQVSRAIKVFGGPAEPLNTLAWNLLTFGPGTGVDAAERLARAAVAAEPSNGFCAHTLCAILAARGRWPEALPLIPVFLADERLVGQQATLIDLLVQAAAAGHVGPVLDALLSSPMASRMEPLVAALRMDLGQEVIVPEEVRLVAEDVLARIREKRVSTG